jgi:hypothetical protein
LLLLWWWTSLRLPVAVAVVEATEVVEVVEVIVNSPPNL